VEVKLSLSEHGMILNIEIPRYVAKSLLGLMNNFNNIEGYETNIKI
jgi:hypothetical protein